MPNGKSGVSKFKGISGSKNIGKVSGIFDAGHGNFIIDISGVFIPKNENFIEKVDLKNKKMIVKNMEGLL